MLENESKTFGVLIEFKLPGGGVDREVEFVEFSDRESAGPEQTLIGIATCRVETRLLEQMAATKTGRNWRIVKVEQIVIDAGPAEPGNH